MYWLTRPAYWRWLAAGIVVAVAGYMDLSGPATENYPFVAVAADPGTSVEVEWRQIPAGLLSPYGDLTGRAQARLEAGTPLVSGLLASARATPPDWWAVPADIPARAGIGSEVLIVMREPEAQVVGIVIEPSVPSTFGGITPGLIAIPPQQAAAVATALAQQRATVLIAP